MLPPARAVRPGGATVAPVAGWPGPVEGGGPQVTAGERGERGPAHAPRPWWAAGGRPLCPCPVPARGGRGRAARPCTGGRGPAGARLPVGDRRSRASGWPSVPGPAVFSRPATGALSGPEAGEWPSPVGALAVRSRPAPRLRAALRPTPPAAPAPEPSPPQPSARSPCGSPAGTRPFGHCGWTACGHGPPAVAAGPRAAVNISSPARRGGPPRRVPAAPARAARVRSASARPYARSVLGRLLQCVALFVSYESTCSSSPRAPSSTGE